MSTPGRRRALRALARRRRANRNRIAQGKKPILEGKQVSASTFRKKTGASTSKSDARRRQKQSRKR